MLHESSGWFILQLRQLHVCFSLKTTLRVQCAAGEAFHADFPFHYIEYYKAWIKWRCNKTNDFTLLQICHFSMKLAFEIKKNFFFQCRYMAVKISVTASPAWCHVLICNSPRNFYPSFLLHH